MTDGQSKHTPGPWVADNPRGYMNFHGQWGVFHGYKDDGSYYAPMCVLHTEADARLIAAAPEFLEHAQAAILGINEAVRVMDLMGRGGAARDLQVYGNNLAAIVRKATAP